MHRMFAGKPMAMASTCTAADCCRSRVTEVMVVSTESRAVTAQKTLVASPSRNLSQTASQMMGVKPSVMASWAQMDWVMGRCLRSSRSVSRGVAAPGPPGARRRAAG
ncbi:MAG: hypothetical protein QM765_40695 [Myxococcales bacterium]